MNPILLSFLCGAAFLGGAAAVVILMLFFSNWQKVTTKKWHDECMEHWKQIAVIQERIADSLERMLATQDEANQIRRQK